MILKAKLEDLNQIMEIIKTTVKNMNEEGNFQWDSSYPKAENFVKDIENESLYIIKDKENNIIKGFICVDYNESEDYKELSWTNNKKAMVIHRIAVNSKYKRQGIGTQLIELGEEIAKENNIEIIKTDTFSVNEKMIALFKKCKFKFVGEMFFKGYEKPFYGFDKVLKGKRLK